MAKSGIYIKPSKRGTFTAAAKSRGKGVQGFASQVMKNPDNYSPAMVKKANFARNAAKWKKELGGYLDQELNETPIEGIPIDNTPVPQTTFGCGGKLARHQDGGYLDLSAPEKKSFSEDAKAMGHTIEEHAAHIFQSGGNLPYSKEFGNITLNAPLLAERHEDLKNLKYLDLPPVDWGSTIAQIGGAALGAARGAGAFQGGGSSGAFDITQTGAGKSIGALGQQQLQNTLQQTGTTNLINSNRGGSFGQSKGDEGTYTFQQGGILPTDAGQGIQAGIGYGVPMDFSQEQQEGYLPAYSDGGELLGYLPEYSFGSWLGDNAGKILKGVGGVVSFIPGFGQIAGPLLIGAGAATDAIVGKVRGKRAQEEALIAEQREEASALKREEAAGYAEQYDPNKNIDYGATFQLGGDLMQGNQAQSQTPIITEYNGKSNSHQEGVGGVPVDSKGNPATVSRQSAVGLTERGEVTWNGYVFSDKLNV